MLYIIYTILYVSTPTCGLFVVTNPGDLLILIIQCPQPKLRGLNKWASS